MMTNEKQPARRRGFACKQFFVAHDRCAMKVGTDGVLLGGWAPCENARHILDIGTGSGLVALMLAQRSQPDTRIDAVDIDADAAAQAAENFLASPWEARMRVFHQDIGEFIRTGPEVRYDLIVSNPPYFALAVACRDSAWKPPAIPRHWITLSCCNMRRSLSRRMVCFVWCCRTPPGRILSLPPVSRTGFCIHRLQYQINRIPLFTGY